MNKIGLATVALCLCALATPNISRAEQTGVPKSAANTRDCNGFGVIAPMFAINSRGVGAESERGKLDVSTPVEAGLGAGYFDHLGFASECEQPWKIGFSYFGWSQGLNPNTTFHIGVGASIDLTVNEAMRFGIGLGVDLFRLEHIRGTADDAVEKKKFNGLFTGRTWKSQRDEWTENLSLLITFSITFGHGDGDGDGNNDNDNDNDNEDLPLLYQ